MLDTPFLGNLDLLLGAVFPGFVPAGFVEGLKVKYKEKIRIIDTTHLPAFLLGVLLAELLRLRPTALVRNVNTALTRFVPARLN